MNRVEFMKQLERLLGDIPENDRLDAITYYNDYFDEAGAENEAQVIRELGSPGKVAAIIKADLNANRDERDLYTEQGNIERNVPNRRESGYHAPKQKKGFNFDFLQKLGKVLMTVIAVMPAAGIMISIGKLIGMTELAWLDAVGAVIENIGWAVITNLSILFGGFRKGNWTL